AFGQNLLQVPDQAARIQYRLGITASQQLVQKLCRKCLRIVLGHTSSSPSRAVYGSSHKNPDTPDQNVELTPSADSYEYYQGTSMAAPHVSGVAALMLSANPNLTPDNVLSII